MMDRAELVVLHAALETVLAWPDSVRDQVAAWLTPAAAKGNGVDHPPPAAAPAPPSRRARAKARQNSPFNVQTRLIEALKGNASLTERALANAAGVSRSSAGERLRALAERGMIEKDLAGRWKLKEEKPRPPTQEAAPDPTQPPAN
jgi:hypothetical protein